MPDELTEAIQASVAQAEDRCQRCQREAEFKRTGRWSPFVGSYYEDPPTKPDHTCDGDLAVFKRGLLAVVDYCLLVAIFGELSPEDRFHKAEAKIHELLPDAKEARDAG